MRSSIQVGPEMNCLRDPGKRSLSRELVRSVAIMLVLLVTAYASHTADAQTFMLPSIGLASGQTARLTVVNNGTTTATETLDILDEMGAILATNTISVAPAHLASVDFPATASQMEVHGRIGPLQFPADLQIFDSTTLSTKVLVEHATAPQPASADLTSPTIGVASGQTARLSIVNDSATTQTQSLFIVSGTGEVLANTMVTLVPGEVGFLDFPNAGSRVEVHAVLATPAVQFPADLEVFDTATLRTSARVEKFHGRFVNVDRMGVPAVNTVSGQVARLAVVNDGTTTERETLSIVNAMGDVLATRTVSVAPGRVAMVQVAIGSSRMEVHGTIEPLIFPADLQVFDIRSQRTIALVEDFKVGLPMSGNVTLPVDRAYLRSDGQALRCQQRHYH
jgi:hypothetical protein